MKHLLLLASLTGCSLDMSGGGPWIPIDDVSGPLVAERFSPATSAADRGAGGGRLRIVTYNVQYGPDPDALAAAIRASPSLARADAILLQEVESHPAESASRSARMAALLGLGYVYVPARPLADGGTHGLAILSSYPISDVRKMDLPESAHKIQHRIAIEATLDIHGVPIQLIDVHLDTDLDTAQRIAQLSPVVRGAPDVTLIAGDFNMGWVEWVGGTVPVLSSTRASDQAPVIDGYMRDQGFDTPSADCGPTEHMFGFEQRLDAFYTRGLAGNFGAVEHVGPSDHWPMWIDVTLQ